MGIPKSFGYLKVPFEGIYTWFSWSAPTVFEDQRPAPAKMYRMAPMEAKHATQ